uniref:Selenoprotein H n=1 Tax=Sinocyclocheilus rhinocerous TaxID=307959 RepID=A0A673KAZ6_9TELE
YAGRGRKRKTDVDVDAEAAAVEEKKEKLGALVASHPELRVVLNPQKPRRNSFEITLMEGDKAEVILWSGIKKGPPRKLKFPDPAEVVSALKEALKS